MNINLPIFQQINLQSSREFYIILVRIEIETNFYLDITNFSSNRDFLYPVTKTGKNNIWCR
jgi:hypothetical protein